MAGPEIEQLVQLLSRLPGLGPRSARRAVLQLLRKKETLMLPLAGALAETAQRIVPCGICGNLDSQDPCAICSDGRREPALLCVVESVADLWALERSGSFRGRYHVLGGTLSALDGVSPSDLNIDSLVRRVTEGMGTIREVILATNATVEGQTTAHYISDRLAGTGIAISRLAHGVPVGGELDYLDDGTLNTALKARRPL
jgi:recombination protein RecR